MLPVGHPSKSEILSMCCTFPSLRPIFGLFSLLDGQPLTHLPYEFSNVKKCVSHPKNYKDSFGVFLPFQLSYITKKGV
jgi:hypothetical protein